MTTRWRAVVPMLVIGALAATFGGAAAAWEPATPAFERIWTRTDGPIVDGRVQRTWTWGPDAVTGIIHEEYADSPGGVRAVQYFDKSRMEITNPNADPGSDWYVTNGLLVVELATGRLQLGDNVFAQRAPAEIPVAGDAFGPSPTYAIFGTLMDAPAYALGQVITTRLAPDGTRTDDPSLAGLDITAYYPVAETGHVVAEPFWYFLTSEQPVYEGGELVSEQMFPFPFYATGLPISEAYWVHTTVRGHETDILVQAFERRVLTYTPTNQAGWQVEAGNVGRHYYQWRYNAAPEENVVVTSIPTGPETIEYFAKGNPRPGEQDWGPSAISIAPDGTFWLTDSVAMRVVRFDREGRKAGEISLVDQGGRSIWDVDASSGTIWISWSNHVLGLYKLQAYTPQGTLLHDFDLPQTLWSDESYTPHGITVNEAGEVYMLQRLGLAYTRLVNADGTFQVTPVDAIAYGGHTWALTGTDAFNRLDVVIDGRSVPIVANEGAFAVVVTPLPGPAGTFYTTRYSVYDNGLDWAIERRAIDGTLLGVTRVPEDDRYIWVEHDLAVGPDGNLYKLMAYRDHLEVLRLGFAEP